MITLEYKNKKIKPKKASNRDIGGVSLFFN